MGIDAPEIRTRRALTGAWIETLTCRSVSFLITVAPSRARGLKLDNGVDVADAADGLALTGAWIETTHGSAAYVGGAAVAPSRARGLKQRSVDELRNEVRGSRPHGRVD